MVLAGARRGSVASIIDIVTARVGCEGDRNQH
jgi:hypothetical protein